MGYFSTPLGLYLFHFLFNFYRYVARPVISTKSIKENSLLKVSRKIILLLASEFELSDTLAYTLPMSGSHYPPRVLPIELSTKKNIADFPLSALHFTIAFFDDKKGNLSALSLSPLLFALLFASTLYASLAERTFLRSVGWHSSRSSSNHTRLVLWHSALVIPACCSPAMTVRDTKLTLTML